MLIGEFGVAARAADPNREPDRFRFCGEIFRIADSVGILPMARFADAITSGGVTVEDELGALAALNQLLRDCLHPDDWRRFQAIAVAQRAQLEDLLPIARGVYHVVTGRPTKRPSDSSAGPLPTGEPSKPGSSSPATDQPWSPPPGRPDLQVDLTPIDTLIGR